MAKILDEEFRPLGKFHMQRDWRDVLKISILHALKFYMRIRSSEPTCYTESDS